MANLFGTSVNREPMAEGKAGKGKADNKAEAPVTETKAEDFSFAIEDNVKLPEKGNREKASKYPWDKLGIGQSFFVPNGKPGTFYTLCTSAKKKYAPKVFTSKQWKQEDGTEGVRVWRTEDAPKESAKS